MKAIKNPKPSLLTLCLATAMVSLFACSNDSQIKVNPELAEKQKDLFIKEEMRAVGDLEAVDLYGNQSQPILCTLSAPSPWLYTGKDNSGGIAKARIPPPSRSMGRAAINKTATAALHTAPASPAYEPPQVVEVHAPQLPPMANRRALLKAINAKSERPPPIMASSDVSDTNTYEAIKPNATKRAANQPISTFSVDVDTGSYANVRNILNRGGTPHPDAVRIEEMINYFDYGYTAPANLNQPFAIHTEMAEDPLHTGKHVLKIGIKGYEVAPEDTPAANLVFLLDTSGSMQGADRLGLIKEGLAELATQLRPQDRVAIVTYAGSAGVVLPSTKGNDAAKIIAALDDLTAGGSTAGGQGIELAYKIAEKHMIKNGVNRILLATDGDFNVGISDMKSLKKLIEAKRKTGIALTTLGVGQGNYHDGIAEQLANVGNGNHAYIDTLNEARKVLIDELSATMMTIAKDVKIQVEFNPAVVSEYRLIGYENRVLATKDFDNDKVDAGEIGAGHEVTALYSVALVGSGKEVLNDEQPTKADESEASRIHFNASEMALVRVRYKNPTQNRSNLIERMVDATPAKSASGHLRFATAVAAFGEAMRAEQPTPQQIKAALVLAQKSQGTDPFHYRKEMIDLMTRYDKLRTLSQMD